MVVNRTILLLGAALVILLASAAEGLKCVKCAAQGAKEVLCDEDHLPEPIECMAPDDKSCGKMVHTVKDRMLADRRCSPVAVPAGHSEVCSGDLCTYLCNTDGCNSSPSSSSFNPLFVWSAVGATLLLFYFKRG